ncbi:hypothetical protein D3C73_1531280 [compost metagenome]
MHIDRTILGFTDLIHASDVVKMGMREQNGFDLQALDSAQQGSRVRTGIDNHRPAFVFSPQQIGIRLQGSQCKAFDIQHHVYRSK